MESGFEISEWKLEEIVFNMINNVESNYIDGCSYKSAKRQMDLGEYGRADIVAFTEGSIMENIGITVFELKKGKISIETLIQATKYKAALKRSTEEYFNHLSFDKITLIGSSVDLSSGLGYFLEVDDSIEVYTYDISHKGITFNDVNHIEKDIRTMSSETFKCLNWNDYMSNDMCCYYYRYLNERDDEFSKKEIESMQRLGML